MYVTRTVYNHSDITYSTILMPSLSEKTHSNIVWLFLVYWLVAWQPKVTTMFINILAIMYWVAARDFLASLDL